MIGANYLENLGRQLDVPAEKVAEIERIVGVARDASRDLSGAGFKLSAERVQAIENSYNQLPPNTRAIIDRVPYEGWEKLPAKSMHQLVEIQRMMQPLASDIEDQLLEVTGEYNNDEPKNGVSAVEITSDLDNLPMSVIMEFIKSLV